MQGTSGILQLHWLAYMGQLQGVHTSGTESYLNSCRVIPFNVFEKHTMHAKDTLTGVMLLLP